MFSEQSRIIQNHCIHLNASGTRLTKKTDTLPLHGHGRPVNPCGMTWSGFRPSDDCCTFGYLIPSNMMAVVALGYAAEIAERVYNDSALADECRILKEDIEDAVEVYGVVNHPKYGRIYAYETDGYGNYNLMDDANSPSLLAIPYFGYRNPDNEIYRNTRRFILSDREEIMRCLEMPAKTHAGTCFMHESFNADNPGEYTRGWFAWVNTLFAQMLEKLKSENFFDA